MSEKHWIDRLISYFNPKAGAKRAHYRAVEDLFQSAPSKRRYEAASIGRRTKGWNALDTGPNAEVKPALNRLRARSRDLVRNNSYASRAIQVISANVVGTGIIPQPKNKKIDELWSSWGDTLQCDSEGQNNFYGIQALALREITEAGEVLIRKIMRRNSDGFQVPLQLQVIEADFLYDLTDRVMPGGGFLKQGIEFDSQGNRVAYHLYRQHPGETSFPGNNFESARIPANEILHIYRKDRAGQIRGVPWGSPALLKLRDFDDYDDAQLIRQKIAACFAAFVMDKEASDGPGNESDALDKKLEPGLIYDLPPGKEITFGNPPAVGLEYEPYAAVTLRAIATGYGVTYESLTQDYSRVNFSSGRMGWIEFHRNIEQWRWNMLIPNLCEPVWDWFVEAAELAGHVSVNRVKKATWTPPKREMIDPVKETEAQVTAIRGGLKTLSEAIREQGNDPEKQMEEMAHDNDLIDQYKLKLDSDPRNSTPSQKNPTPNNNP
ncbi:MAG: phage portal protein [Deltaproteobacteria bacterium]|nr:phage portal protein [Deltaproteobacteria bacterium]